MLYLPLGLDNGIFWSFDLGVLSEDQWLEQDIFMNSSNFTVWHMKELTSDVR